VGYLSGSLDADREAVVERVERDGRVRRTMLDVQDLASTGLVREELPLGQLRFVGVVGTDRAFVNILTDTRVDKGDRIVIRRREGGLEVPVAEAIAVTVDADRVRIRVEDLELGLEVETQDLAYVRRE
jgi:hypothetical protein